jgi:hypothetical protein
MIDRRLLMSGLAVLGAAPALAVRPDEAVSVHIALPPPEQPGPDWALAAVLAACWQARGHRFTQAAIVARIGRRSGADAWTALTGPTVDAEGLAVETRLRVLLEPATLGRDRFAKVAVAAGIAKAIGRLGAREPLLLVDRTGAPWLVTGYEREKGLWAQAPGDGRGRWFGTRAFAALIEPMLWRPEGP